MNATEKAQREMEIFELALDLASSAERLAFLKGACGEDTALLARVQALLQSHESAEGFLPEQSVGQSIPVLLSEKPGDRIGRYKLLQKIGEGGMGVVYMAEQEEPVRRRVALKILKLGMDTQQVVARFEAERQALALMDHPNMAKVLDGGATDTGRPFFVMELVQGVPITEFCDKNQLPAEERIKLFIQVCQAIQSAHQKGIIHRDIKPTNIMVTLNAGVPVPMVIDFGVAKATRQKLTEKTVFTQYATMIGTPAYMSPEQAAMSRLDVDTRSDIYGLGVLLYELLTGTTPFPEKRLRSASYQEMQRIILEEEPERPSTRLRQKSAEASTPSLTTSHWSLSTDLDWIVMKCLEKDRSRRYETANGLATDLKRHLENEPVLARPPSAAYRLQKAWRRNKTACAFVVLMAAVLVAATIISSWQAFLAKQAEKLAARRSIESENARKEAEVIAEFLTELFQSPDPTLSSRTVTVGELLDASAKKLETELTGQPGRRAKLLATLAWTYHMLGFDLKAIPLQEKVRDYRLGVGGPEHPDTLKALQILAIFYDNVGREAEALKLREEVLPLRRKVSGPIHDETLWAIFDLATSYGEAGRLNEALKLREEILEIAGNMRGPEHWGTISTFTAIAQSYIRTRRTKEAHELTAQLLPEALKMYEQLLALRRKTLGPDHPDTLSTMTELAKCYDQAGRRDEALKLREEVLTLSRKVLGPEHLGTAEAMGWLAVSYQEADRRAEALKLWEEDLAVHRKVDGPNNSKTSGILNAMAWILATSAGAEIRNGSNAVKMAESAVGTYRGNPDLLDTLAAAYAEVQQFDKAVAVEQEAIGLAQNDQEKQDYVSRLKGYQDHKPFRDKVNR